MVDVPDDPTTPPGTPEQDWESSQSSTTVSGNIDNRGAHIGQQINVLGPSAKSLDADWFSVRLDTAFVRAGPRYNPQLHTGHALDGTLAALCDTKAWRERREEWHRRFKQAAEKWNRAIGSTGDPMLGPFPAAAFDVGKELQSTLNAITTCLDDEGDLGQALAESRAAEGHAHICERLLANDINDRFGEGSADSVSFRQYQAEIECVFPAQYLDDCRKLVVALGDLVAWLQAPAIRAAEERILVLTGPAGIGKTHGLCDEAERRRQVGLLTVLVSGSQFGSERTVWESLAAALDLDSSWSRDVLLNALDTAGQGSGRLLICIDALDERTQRSRWQDDLPEITSAIKTRPNLALCVSVRDGYQHQVLRDGLDLPMFEHPGFGDTVFDACTAFFRHFELEPPVGPLLEPEFGNPLFLLILCKTLAARNLTSVPPGWRGTRQMLGRLLKARDKELQKQFPGVGNRAVTAAMEALAEAIPEGGTLGWSEADRLVFNALPCSQQGQVDLLDRLVGLDLLRIVPGDEGEWGTDEDRVDVAFGRLRHYLIAGRLARSTPPASDSQLRLAALKDPGLAESLALLLPERGRGELVDLASNPAEWRMLMEAWVASLPWRDSDTLGNRVKDLLWEGLKDPDFEHGVLDALLTLALRPGHRYDHHFLHDFLARFPMPRRDGAGFCWYLHRAFERTAPPSPLVRVLQAPWETDPSRLGRELLIAWCVVLGWCGAAADRRVRDHATKAAVRLSEHDPSIWVALIDMFADVNDDAVVERVLCAAYGAVLRNPVPEPLAELALSARDRVLRVEPDPPSHALIRGHAQAIGEWAAHRGVLPEGVSVEDFRPPHARSVHLDVPSASELEQYKDDQGYLHIYASVMSEWTGDFAKYTMPSVLRGYESLLDREATRRWIMGAVIEMGYDPRIHGHYDYNMHVTHGAGRGRPEWAERIGKKYQRIALGRLLGRLDDLAHMQGTPASSFPCHKLRDIDPSLLQRKPAETVTQETARWWAPITMDFANTASLTDEGWVGEDDFPDPAAIVATLIDPCQPDQRWRLLDGQFSWSDRELNEDNKRCRDVWMTIKGYLVSRQHTEAYFDLLGESDFFGGWMMEGIDEGGGIFAGEHPWAPHFPDLRTPVEPWEIEAQRFLKFGLRPTANDLGCTGDSWQDGSISMAVPSVELIEATKTRWDGVSGFQTEDGRVLFRDPSVTTDGPSGLWMDDDALAHVRENLDVDLVWTVLAERRIVGTWRDNDFCGAKRISMAMYLDGDRIQVRRGRGEHLLPDRTTRPA